MSKDKKVLLLIMFAANVLIPFALALFMLVCFGGKAFAGEPEPTINLPCKVVDVYDGDTITVELRVRVRVRLLDCWAPEIKTKDADEKERGIIAKQRMVEIADSRRGLLVVPLSGVDRLDDIFTFGRILGRVYIEGNPDDVSTLMTRDGYATKTKNEAKIQEVDP